MRQHFPSKSKIRGLCAEPGEDDGVDPHLSARRMVHHLRSRRSGSGPEGADRPVDRKACQLCRQVAVTLDEVLAECGDPVLQGLHVMGVSPFPDATRPMVTVAPVDDQTGLEVVLDHLQRANGHLRCEVATAVTRKRTPLLMYRLADPVVDGH